MKKLIFINGTMGVGKTTVSQLLKKQLSNSVFLDGDWCWDASPFVVNEETKTMVIDNITTLLSNFLTCNAYEHIIFCWVMDEPSIMDTIIEKLKGTYELYIFSLLVDEETLSQRLKKDIIQGLRSEDVLQRSIERNQKYRNMNTISIETNNKQPIEIVLEIEEILYN
jgi:shikimate kinase